MLESWGRYCCRISSKYAKAWTLSRRGASNLGNSRSWMLMALRSVPRETVVKDGLVNDIVTVAAVGRGVDGGVVVCLVYVDRCHVTEDAYATRDYKPM